MPGVQSGDVITREDLSPAFLNLDARKTVFLSRVGRGDQLTNTLFSWTAESFDGRMTEGIPENKDVDAFEGDTQAKFWNRSQKFWRRPHVTVESNTIVQTPGDMNKYTKQVAKKTKEQQRDVECRMLDDRISRDDDGVKGREWMGLGRVINDGVSVGSAGAALPFSDPQTVIPAGYRTPTSQIYVGALTNLQISTGNISITFGEDQVLNMLQNRFDNFGASNQLEAFVDSLLKRHFSKYFGKYAANVQGYTTVVQSLAAAQASRAYAMQGVDLIETDFGPIAINLISFMPRRPDGTLAGRGYFLDLELIKIRPSGLWQTHQQLEDKGAGPRGLIQSILGYEFGDPRAHCKVDPNVVQTTT
jgi:hypothetical protein